MRMRIKDRSGLERQSKEFLAFARSYLSDAFPNPDRQGCPPDEALQSLAVNPSESQATITEHIASCSPCFRRYSELLTDVQLQRTADRALSWKGIFGWFRAHPLLVGAVLACALFIAIGVGLWIRFSVPNPPPLETHQPHNPTSPVNPEVAYSPFALDLTNISPIRGSNPPTTGSQRRVRVPSSTLDLTLSLPLGSEEQTYSVSLKSAAGRTFWSKYAKAQLNKGQILIRAQADFRQVPAGNYNLEIKSAAGIRLIQPVSIQATVPNGTGQKP
jgi:hypothetical protein